MASQVFASAFRLVAAPTNGGVFALHIIGSGQTAPKFNVSVTDVNATGTDANIDLLGNVVDDAITTTGFNNTNAQYWGTATVTSNGVAHDGIIIYDPNGQGAYWFLSGASSADLSGTLSATAAKSSAGINTWTLAGTGAPAAPAFTVSDDAGSVRSGNLAANGSTDDTTLTLSGTAGAGATVRIYDGSTSGTPIGTVVVGPDGKWSYTTGALSQGAHTLNVTQRGTDGATSTAAGFTVTVDTTAPSAPTIGSATDDAGAKTGTFANGGVTDDTTPTLAVALPANAVAGDTVKVFNGANEVGSRVVTSADVSNRTASVAVTSPVTGDGAKTLTATITDAAGNTSGAGSFGYTLDTTPPSGTTTIRLAEDTGTGGDGITSNPALTGVATGHQSGDTVTIKDNGVVVGTAAIGPNGVWNFTPTNAAAADGSHSYTAALTDAAGNGGQATATSPASTTVDKTADADVSVDLTDAAVLAGGGGARVALSISGLDAGSTAAVTFTGSAGGSVVRAFAANGAHTADVSGLRGDVTASVSVADAAGNAAAGRGETLAADPVCFMPGTRVAVPGGASGRWKRCARASWC